jgi:protein-S-isoprenylcysteine O-methyltransferase Ste14
MFKDPNLYIPDAVLWAFIIPLGFIMFFVIVCIYYDKKEERKTKKKYDSYPKAYRSKVSKKVLDDLLDFHERAISN